jgi:hypothetical protein
VGLRRLTVGLISRPRRTVKGPVARRPAPEGTIPVRRRTLPLRAAETTPAPARQAPGGGGSDGEEGSGDGNGDEGGGDGDAEIAVNATVELNEKGKCKRDPEFLASPLKLPTRGAVYILRFNAAETSPTDDEVIGPQCSSNPARSAAGFTPHVGPR